MLKLAGAVEAVQNWNFPGMGNSTEAGISALLLDIIMPCKVARMELLGCTCCCACLACM